MDPDEGAPIWLITGVVAAGKSTVAQSLAGRLPRAAHVRGGSFRRMIVSGGATGRSSAEARRQMRLRHGLTAATADGFAAAGFAAVAQDVILGPELPAFVAAVTRRPLHVVILAPSLATVRERAARREQAGPRAARPETLDRVLRRRTPRLGLWLDTTGQTPEETVDEILARREEARVG